MTLKDLLLLYDWGRDSESRDVYNDITIRLMSKKDKIEFAELDFGLDLGTFYESRNPDEKLQVLKLSLSEKLLSAKVTKLSMNPLKETFEIELEPFEELVEVEENDE